MSELSKEEKRKSARKEYYQKNRVKICRYTIHDSFQKSVLRDKNKAQHEAIRLMKKYPYENYTLLFKKITGSYGISKGKYAHQECEDAAQSAYMYSVYRCAAEGYDYVDRYIRKMMNIYILCAVVVSYDEMKSPSWDEDFERINSVNNF